MTRVVAVLRPVGMMRSGSTTAMHSCCRTRARSAEGTTVSARSARSTAASCLPTRSTTSRRTVATRCFSGYTVTIKGSADPATTRSPVRSGLALVCKHCNSAPTYGRSRYCSKLCRNLYSYHHPGTLHESTCRRCNKVFRPKLKSRTTFCSRECAFSDWKLNGKQNQKFSERQCALCKKPFIPTATVDRCVKCRAVRKALKKHDSTHKMKPLTKSSRRGMVIFQHLHQPRKNPACKSCGIELELRIHGQGKQFQFCAACSKENGKDAKSASKRLRKARAITQFVERVVRKQIYQRDGWKCGICGKGVNKRAKVPHPLAKTIDHIIPLSKGGTHEPKNVRLAHFICNSKRGNDVVAQLRMF